MARLPEPDTIEMAAVDPAERMSAPAPDPAARIASANALQQFITQKLDADTAAAADLDYATLPERYRDGLSTAAGRLAGGIDDAPARAHFLASARERLATGYADVQRQADARQKAADRDWLSRFINSGIDAAIRAPDEGTRADLFRLAHQAIDGMAGKGALTPEESLALKRGVPASYAQRRAVSLVRSDPAAAVQAFGSSTSDDTGAPTFESSGDWRDFLDPLERSALAAEAQRNVEARNRAAELDAQQQERSRAQQVQAASDAAEGRVIAGLSGMAPAVSAAQLADPNGPFKDLTAEKRAELADVLARTLQPEPPNPGSRATLRELLGHIYSGGEDSLPDTSALNRAYADGQLTWNDFQRARQAFTEAQTPEGALLGRRTLALLDRVAPAIGGTESPAFADFAANLDRMIARYRREGKDPFELLDPSKADYVGKPEAITTFAQHDSAAEPQASGSGFSNVIDSIARIAQGAVAGGKAGFGDERLGSSPEAEKALRDAGVYPNYEKSHTPIQVFNKVVIDRIAEAIDLANRTGSGAGIGIAEAVGQVAREFGASDTEATSLMRDTVAAEQAMLFGLARAPAPGNRGRAGRAVEREEQVFQSGFATSPSRSWLTTFDPTDAIGSVRRFVAKLTSGGNNHVLDYGSLDTHSIDLARAAGWQLDGNWHRILDASAYRHIKVEHGTNATELPRGLVPVTDADLARVPEIMAAAEKAVPGTTRTGRPALTYDVTLPDGSYYYVEEVRVGRHVVAVQTIAKRPD